MNKNYSKSEPYAQIKKTKILKKGWWIGNKITEGTDVGVQLFDSNPFVAGEY